MNYPYIFEPRSIFCIFYINSFLNNQIMLSNDELLFKSDNFRDKPVSCGGGRRHLHNRDSGRSYSRSSRSCHCHRRHRCLYKVSQYTANILLLLKFFHNCHYKKRFLSNLFNALFASILLLISFDSLS